MRIIILLLLAGGVLYALYVGYFFTAQRSILFPRHLNFGRDGPAPAVGGLETIWLTTSQGQVEAWYLPPLGDGVTAPAPLMIISHGNAERIDDWVAPVTGLRRMGIGVLLVEYPGYGRSQGHPTQASIGEALVAAYDLIIDHPQVNPDAIILFGRSVGGGAAAALAAQRPSAALILFSSFTSVRALAVSYGLPGLAVRDPFDVLSVVRTYPNPVLILHGQHDRTIPYTHGLALHAAAANGELITYACGHNDCIRDWDRFWEELRPFLTRAGVSQALERAGNKGSVAPKG
ncbi:MAG: alpha/beta hydrolase [Chloroflexi bacterium]|nr:MAG: alpha/beta hydrolase [Chloroflexota bacterium]